MVYIPPQILFRKMLQSRRVTKDNECKVLAEMSERSPLGKSNSRWRNNIKIYHKGIERDGLDRVLLV
jgi:hypothetical protein